MQKISGFLLIFAGTFLVMAKSQWLPLEAFVSWYFLFSIIGLMLIVIAFLRYQASMALFGGVLTTISLSSWGGKYFHKWPTHWSSLVVGLGISFLLKFAINKDQLTGIVGAVLLICGFFAWPGIRDLPMLSPIAHNLNTYWPVFLIGLGVIIMVKK